MKKYTNEEVRQIVLTTVTQTLKGDPMTFLPTTPLSTYETWDSLRQLELMNNLEQAFKITLPVETIIEMTTVQTIEKLVVQHLS